MHIASIYTITAALAIPLPQSNAALLHASNLRKELGPPQVSELAKLKKLVKTQKVEINSLTDMVRQMEEKLDEAHLRIVEHQRQLKNTPWTEETVEPTIPPGPCRPSEEEVARDDVPKYPDEGGSCILPDRDGDEDKPGCKTCSCGCATCNLCPSEEPSSQPSSQPSSIVSCYIFCLSLITSKKK